MAFNETINTGTTAGDGTGDGLRTNMRKLIENDNFLKNKIENFNPVVAKTFLSLALAQSVTPTPEDGTPFRVYNVNDPSENGRYSWQNGNTVKEEDLYENEVIEENTTKGVTGKAVAPIRDFRNFKFSSKIPFSFVNGVFSNAGPIYVFNNAVSGYIKIDNFSQDLSGLAVGDEGWYTYYLKANNIKNFLRGDVGSWVFDNSSILSKKWSDTNIDDLKANDVLVLFHYNSMQQTIKSPFLDEYSSKKIFESVLNENYVKNIRRETQFQIFNKDQASGNIDVEFDNNGSAIITLTGELFLHTGYKKPAATTAYTRLVAEGGSKTITVPIYKSLYLDIEAALINSSYDVIPDSAYSMTNDIADANMIDTFPTDKVLLFSNWSQDFKGASGLFKDYIIGKKVELIKESNTPLVNLHPQVLQKLPVFIEKYAYGAGATAETPCNIIMLGDSLFAREVHTSIKDVVPSENPPTLVTKNIGAYLNQYIQGQKPIYSRYDKNGVFTEVGTWVETTTDTSWDDNNDRPIHTKKTTSANASLEFTTDKPYFNLVDRIDVNGSSSLTVSITGGNGRVLARIENTANWVEANGFNFSQNKANNGGVGNGFGNTRYQRRVEFKKVGSGIGTSDTITITKPNNATTFMYWGIEEIEENKPFTRIINVARGGHKLSDLELYIEDDVYARNLSLVILEIPLLNMIASNTTLDYNLNQLQDFVWGDRVGFENSNSLKNRSNNWQDFNVLLVLPHHSRAHFNVDSTFKKEASNYTAEEIYKAVKGLIFSKGDLPFIDISTAFLNEIDVDVNFSDRYSAMGNSGISGAGYFSDSIHQNDKGTSVWAKHLCPLLQLN